MNTIKNLALLGLVVLAGYWVWYQKLPESEKRGAQEFVEAPVVAEAVNDESEAEIEPSEPSVVPPVAQDAPPAPLHWYTLRRITLTTDTGIAAIPVGVRVERIEEGGAVFAMYQGRRFPAKHDDLTTDEIAALRSRPPTTIIGSDPTAPIAPPPAVSTTASTSKKSSKDRAQEAEMRSQVIKSIDDQIDAVNRQIEHEMRMAETASRKGKSSARGVTIQRLRKELDALTARRIAAHRAPLSNPDNR